MLNSMPRMYVDISSWRIRKEELAHKRQKSEHIEKGLIGVWSCFESGSSYRAVYCKKTGYPQLQNYQTPCKHLYFYFDDEEPGFKNIRLQTWFPYHPIYHTLSIFLIHAGGVTLPPLISRIRSPVTVSQGLPSLSTIVRSKTSSSAARATGMTVVRYCSPACVAWWTIRCLKPTGKGTKSARHWPRTQAACMAPSSGNGEPSLLVGSCPEPCASVCRQPQAPCLER